MSRPSVPVPDGQLVKYGDTFYIYAYMGDGSQAGWVYQTGNSTNYLALSTSFNQGGNAPSAAFTVLPAENFKVNSGKSGAPSGQSNQFTLQSNGVNMLGKGVQRSDVFYLGLSSVLGQSEWYNSDSYASITGKVDQAWLTDINNYPYNGQLQASNITGGTFTNAVQYLTYSSSFYLGAPFNDIGSCSVNGTSIPKKNTAWTIKVNGGIPELYPIYQVSCPPKSPIPAYFVFVPTATYHCSNFSCQPFSLSDYRPGDFFFTNPTCDNVCQPPPVTYACVDNVCQPSPGGSKDSTCGGGCPAATYSCTGGQCIASSTGTLTLEDCTTICGSYNCAAGVCLAVVAGSSAGTFSSQSSCSSACQESGGTNWWLWGLAALFLILFLGGILVAIVVVLVKSKKKKSEEIPGVPEVQ